MTPAAIEPRTEARLGGLYAAKPWFARRLRPVEEALVRRRVPADALTGAGLTAAVLAGAAIAAGGALDEPGLWLAVPPLLVIRLGANAMDGSVARRTGTSRPFGAALNEMGDRLGDAAIIAGAATVAGGSVALGAVAAAFLASFTGVVSWALTGDRDRGGPMGKADRMAVVSAGAVTGGITGSPLPIVAAVWLIAIGSVITALLRVVRLRAALAGGAPRVPR